MKTRFTLALLVSLHAWLGFSAGTELNPTPTTSAGPGQNPVWTRLLEKASAISEPAWNSAGNCACPSSSMVFTGSACSNLWTKPEPLPPLDPGVTELKFGEFFRNPVGPRGLEPTEKLRRLEGQRVRLLGYMVSEERAAAGRLLLTPFPTQIHSHDCALADDLPPSTVHVFVPAAKEEILVHTPKLLLLTGTLRLGSRAEPDGRTSLVRLLLDPPKAAPTQPDSTADREKLKSIN